MFRMNHYKDFDFIVEKASGVYIFDESGNRYLDTFSDMGVLALGHSNPKVLAAQQTQMNRFEHISNFFVQDDAQEIAKVLVEKTNRTGQVFFTNSGTEAVEAALKAVKKKAQQTGKKKIITFTNSFHASSLASLSLNCIRIPFNDLQGFKSALQKYADDTLALFLEPVLSSSGVVGLDKELAQIISGIVGKKDIILVCDEIQAGLGRTGKFYSYQHYDLQPDIIILGKAIGGGLPLGATVFLNGTEMIFQQTDHGSTFAPNSVSIAGGKVVVSMIAQLLEEIEKKGQYLVSKIKDTDKIREIRQTGLMIGISMKKPDSTLRERALKKGLLINLLNESVIGLLPAFTIEYSEIDQMTDLLNDILK